MDEKLGRIRRQQAAAPGIMMAKKKISDKPSSTGEDRESVVIRFAGDSGDGMQLTGRQFSNTSAIAGNDISTLPDFPAEIRAPAGSIPGVSAYQIHFSSVDILTPGDEPEVLVAMNPAALKSNLHDLKPDGRVIVNTDAFTGANLKKANYEASPLDDGTLASFQVIAIPIATLNAKALEGIDLPRKEADRSKNLWALGLLYWLYDRPLEPTLRWLERKFAGNDILIEANRTALLAGYAYAEASEIFTTHFRVREALIAPGRYRKITGNEALVLGCVAAGILAKTQVIYASYPITPASEILHGLSTYRRLGVRTVQAEDEIAAMGMVVGAAFGGGLAVTGTSGPGLALKAEAINLAVMAELPCVIINVQRAGPSTGMPTKTEQGDLLQAVFGRNGESPVAVLAQSTPSDGFDVVLEAFRTAVRHMVPVIILSDGYLGNGAEPWKIPDIESLEPIDMFHPEGGGKPFHPYERAADTLARPWAIPGTAGLEHRIGGLEKEDVTGDVSYDPANHQRMTDLRREKLKKIADFYPPVEVDGDGEGDLLVLSWGSTFGAVRTAVGKCRGEGRSVSHVHLRHVHPFPNDLGEIIGRFGRVLIPELNGGQLLFLIRSAYLVGAEGLNKVEGRPFMVAEVASRIREMT